jgi:hypothetical protein
MRGPGALLLALLAVSASGQAGLVPTTPLLEPDLELLVDAPKGRIAPFAPFQVLGVRVTYRFLEAVPEFEAVPISFQLAETAPYVVTTISPSMLYFSPSVPPCLCEREVQMQAYLLLSTTAEAPAFRDFLVELRAEAPAHGIHGPAATVASLKPQADYFAIVEASTPELIHRLAPGEERRLPVTVTNFGNGASTITFSLLIPPPEGLEVLLPAPARLGALQQGEPNVMTTEVVLRAGPVLTEGQVRIQIHATSAEVPGSKSDATFISMYVLPQQVPPPSTVQSAGPVRAAPGLELTWLLPGLAGVALLRRRAGQG